MAFHLTINEVIKMWSIKYPKPEDIDTAIWIIYRVVMISLTGRSEKNIKHIRKALFMIIDELEKKKEQD
jgi:hypothetical protein